MAVIYSPSSSTWEATSSADSESSFGNLEVDQWDLSSVGDNAEVVESDDELNTAYNMIEVSQFHISRIGVTPG